MLDASAANAVSGNSRQTFYGSSVLDASAANAVSGNSWQEFYGSSVLDASAANAVSGNSLQTFFGYSALDASAANAVSGYSQQLFNSYSVLKASVANAISGSSLQTFSGNSALDASAANAVSGYSKQLFNDDSVLKASAANAVSGYSGQTFYGRSVLYASAADAVSGNSRQTFRNDSVLKVSVANAVSGNSQQTFYDNSALDASAANAVSGNSRQTFRNDSVLKASVANAVSGGVQSFFDSSALEASAPHAINGGARHFWERSTLNALADGAVSGGDHNFYEDSALNGLVEYAVRGGAQAFNDRSMLNASAAHAVSGGAQVFWNSSELNASVAQAVSGGTQDFWNTSKLNVSADNGISEGDQTFYSGSALWALAGGAIGGGRQIFQDASVLEASAGGAVQGGKQLFHGKSALNALAGNAVSGGTQAFFDTSALNASVADAVSGGTQDFWDSSVLNALAAGAVRGGAQVFYNDSILNVLADDAVAPTSDIRFDNSHGGMGGALRLNGFSTAVGAISSSAFGSGVISNGAPGNATLTVDASQSGPSVFSGQIHDGGAGALSLVVAGGELTLTGAASHTGGTTVSGGSLIVGTSAGGTLEGAITVGSGGLLGGIGSIGSAGSAVTIAAGGAHAPGNSIGVQAVAGDYVNHGTLRIEATPASADRLVVAGAVDITGATLELTLSPTDAAAWDVFNGPFIIIDKQSAGAVVGAFAAPHTRNLLFLDAPVAYDGGDGNDVTLTLERNDLTFASVGQTPNQIATATAIETLGRAHAVWRSIALSQDPDIARASFDALAGDLHASTKTALIEDGRFLRNAANDRIRAVFGNAGASTAPVLSYGGPGHRVSVAADHAGPAFWSTGFGSWGRTKSDGNAAPLDRSAGGLLIGADGRFGAWRLGGLAGYSHSSYKADDRASSLSGDHYHLGLYGGRQWGALTLRTGAAYTWHDLSAKRALAIPGIADSLKAGYRAGTVQAFGELGYGVERGQSIRVEPFANLAHVRLRTDGYTEAGGSAALRGEGDSTGVTFTTLGLRAEWAVNSGPMAARLKGMLGWRRAFGDTTPTSIHAFSAGSAFSIAGVPLARDSVAIEAGLEVKLTADANLSLSYTGQIAGSAREHGFKANLGARF